MLPEYQSDHPAMMYPKEKAPLDAEPLRAYVRAMRMILTGLALVALCSPAIGQDCRFFNATGQSIDFRPKESAMTLIMGYDDGKYECRILGPQSGNAYGVACQDGPGKLVIGMSEPDKPFVDILVFDDIFFWLKCEETT